MFKKKKEKKENFLKDELKRVNYQIDERPTFNEDCFSKAYFYSKSFVGPFRNWLEKVEQAYAPYMNQKKDFLTEIVMQSKSDFLKEHFSQVKEEFEAEFKKFEEKYDIKSFLKEGRNFLRSIITTFKKDHLIKKNHEHFNKLKEEYEDAYETLKKKQSDIDIKSVINKYRDINKAYSSSLEFIKDITKKPLTTDSAEDFREKLENLDDVGKNFFESLKESKNKFYEFLSTIEPCFKLYVTFQLHNYAYSVAEKNLEKIELEDDILMGRKFYQRTISAYDIFIKKKILLIKNLEPVLKTIPDWKDMIGTFEYIIKPLERNLQSTESKNSFVFNNEFLKLSSKLMAEGYHKNNQKRITTGAKLRAIVYPKFYSGPYNHSGTAGVVINSERNILMHSVSETKPGHDGSWNSSHHRRAMTPEEYVELLEKIMKTGLKPSERNDSAFKDDEMLKELQEVFFFMYDKHQTFHYGPCYFLVKPENKYTLFKGTYLGNQEFFILTKRNIPVIKEVLIARNWQFDKSYYHNRYNYSTDSYLGRVEELLKEKKIPYKNLDD